ncbi:MAG: tetratricopeptide repeat protein [Candidatus Eisenbacteria bacterium]
MSFVDRWLRAGREAQYRRAIDFYNEGHYEAAVVAFGELLSGEVNSHDPRVSLARFYLAESHCEIGWGAMDEGDLSRARDSFIAALGAGYRYPDLQLRLGRIREELGELDEAEEAYLAALAIHDGLFEARARRVRLRLSRGLPVESDLQRLVADGLGLPEGWEALASSAPAADTSASEGGDRAPQLESLAEAVRSRIAEELDVRERVAEQVRLALEAFDTLDAASALEKLEGAVALRPQYPDLHFRIGVLHARAGRFELAVTSLERALELNPKYEEALRWLERVRTLDAA